MAQRARRVRLRIGILCVLSLTPALRPGCTANMDISRFNGLRSLSNVHSFLFPLLDPSNLGNTESRKKLLNKTAAARVSRWLSKYAEEQCIYMKINYVNADHVHALVDLPTSVSIERLIQLLKGRSSHWVNSNNLITGKFAWGRGYGAFSVSESNVDQIARYIAQQEEHHRMRTFAEELKEFIDRHGLQWREESR